MPPLFAFAVGMTLGVLLTLSVVVVYLLCKGLQMELKRWGEQGK